MGDNDNPPINECVSGASNSAERSLSPELRTLLDADESAVAILELDKSVRDINESALDLLGVKSADELLPESTSWGLLLSLLDHAPRHLSQGSGDGTWQGDIDFTDPIRGHRVYRSTVTVRHDRSLTGGGFIGLTAHDVTAARDEAARLHHRATHDPLTRLANRRQILETLARAIDGQSAAAGHVAAIFVDIDRLKHVNDAFGHQVGDGLLCATAERLIETIRPEDHVARIGGDEFLVVCSAMPDAGAAFEMAERVHHTLTGQLRVDQIDVHVSVSVGVALCGTTPPDSAVHDAAIQLVHSADMAMYAAKRAGRGGCVLFTVEMGAAAHDRNQLAADLAGAIERRELTLEYQPVISAVTDTVVGAAVNGRWNHATRGPIDPAEFTSIAQESGSIGALGELMLEQATSTIRSWIDDQVVDANFTVHVPVAPLQLVDSSFVTLVADMLRRQQLQPDQLVLRLQDATLSGADPDSDRSVGALRRSGVRIAIDNFGCGPNALPAAIDTGADLLRIDASLALPPGSSHAEARLVRAIVLLGHALDMTVVADRVTAIEQLNRLYSAGCDQVQGPVFGPAGPADKLVATISDSGARRTASTSRSVP